MEKTAVEFLWNRLFEIKKTIQFDEQTKAILNAYHEAIEMEKEQIVQAHGNKQKTKSNPDSIVTFGYTYTGEMYYNQKYKGINPII